MFFFLHSSRRTYLLILYESFINLLIRFRQTAVPVLPETTAAIFKPPGVFGSVKKIPFNFRSEEKIFLPSEYKISKSFRLLILSLPDKLYIPVAFIHHSLLTFFFPWPSSGTGPFGRLQCSFFPGNRVYFSVFCCSAGMFSS